MTRPTAASRQASRRLENHCVLGRQEALGPRGQEHSGEVDDNVHVPEGGGERGGVREVGADDLDAIGVGTSGLSELG